MCDAAQIYVHAEIEDVRAERSQCYWFWRGILYESDLWAICFSISDAGSMPGALFPGSMLQ